MAFQFNGEQVCSRCGHKYEWMTIPRPDHGEYVSFRMDLTKSNVKNCTRINQTNHYCVEIGCPECGKRDFVEVVRE